MSGKPRISVIGLGKLGSPMLASLAEKGFNVLGVDLNQETVEKINRAEAPVFEPLLQEFLTRNKERFKASTSVREAVLQTDISFVVVPTPSNENGEFSSEFVKDALRSIAEAIKDKASYHLVVVTSTVMPGTSDKELLPLLETVSGKTCTKDFGYCYSPEFIALGNVIKDLLNPDFFLIGESDERAGSLLENLYSSYCENTPCFRRMNYVNAELTKIAVNTFVTTKISFANMLAELCEQLPGGNIDVVSEALGKDSRIGPKYLKGGTAYGGPCFPRDNIAFATLCRKLGVEPSIAQATDEVNSRQHRRIYDQLKAELKAGATVSILGTAYKTGTNFAERSQGADLARIFAENGFKVRVWDPLANEAAKKILKDTVTHAKTLSEAVSGADAVVLTLPYKEFRELPPELLAKNTIIMDCWRTLDAGELGQAIVYKEVGRGPEKLQSASRKELTVR